MNSVERQLAEEIKELESKIRSNPVETATTTEEEPVIETTKTPVEETIEEEVVETTEEPTEDLTKPKEEEESEDEGDEETQKPQRVNWKKRFSSYKAKTDATIFTLRQEKIRLSEENLQFKKKVNELMSEVNTLKASHQPEILSEEEQRILGDDAVTSMQKLMDAKLKLMVDPLKAQLEEERKLREQNQEHEIVETRAANEALFLAKLEELVPNYAEIDSDPKFLQWMEQIEPESGLQRAYIFKQAQAIGDVKRVASYFLNYTDPKKNILDKYITPPKTSTNTTTIQKPKQPERISMAFIDKFYDDAIRGRYKGKEKLRQEIEAKINFAISHGLVSK